MATAVFTTVEARVDQQLTNAIWKDEIQDNLNQLGGAHRQLLVNGGFELWQRSAGPFTANGAYTADRWLLNISGGTATVTQDLATLDGSAASLKIVTVGSVIQNVAQKLEDFKQLRGRTIAFSVRVNQSVASAVTANIFDGAGSAASATSATTGAFVTLTVTKAIGAADVGPVSVTVAFSAAGTFYVDNAMLVIGPAPAPYQPLHPQEDLARCQRYYEVQGGALGPPFLSSYGAAGATGGVTIPFAVWKGGTPTITKNGTWAVTNCGQPTVASPVQFGCTINTVITALGTYGFNPNSSDDNVVIEYNVP